LTAHQVPPWCFSDNRAYHGDPTRGERSQRTRDNAKGRPVCPSATSYGMGWKGLQAVRYRDSSGSEFSGEGTSRTHAVVLHVPETTTTRFDFVISYNLSRLLPRKLPGTTPRVPRKRHLNMRPSKLAVATCFMKLSPSWRLAWPPCSL
jgi:hypothetical protein